MAKYALMAAPIEEDDYSSQIKIIDNATAIGKKKVEKLINEGWSHVGSIESELRVMQLTRGFQHDLEKRLDAGKDLLQSIEKMAGQFF